MLTAALLLSLLPRCDGVEGLLAESLGFENLDDREGNKEDFHEEDTEADPHWRWDIVVQRCESGYV